MSAIEIIGKEEVIEKLNKTPNKVRDATRMALNRTITRLRTQMAREAATKYFVKVGDARKTITTRKASNGNLTAEAISRGRPISLIKFKVTPRSVQHRGRHNKKVKVRVKRNGTGSTLDRAFVIASGGGGFLAERTGKSRYPIKKLFGPSVPQMLKNEDTQKALKETSSQNLNKELNRQIARLLK